jgi:hypothetical protein
VDLIDFFISLQTLHPKQGLKGNFISHTTRLTVSFIFSEQTVSFNNTSNTTTSSANTRFFVIESRFELGHASSLSLSPRPPLRFAPLRYFHRFFNFHRLILNHIHIIHILHLCILFGFAFEVLDSAIRMNFHDFDIIYEYNHNLD